MSKWKSCICFVKLLQSFTISLRSNFLRYFYILVGLVPRLASAVTLARARARGAGLSRTVQKHSNLPDLGSYRTRMMRAME